MTALTYGTLPTIAYYRLRFRAVVGKGGSFVMNRGPLRAVASVAPESGSYDELQLWAEIKRLERIHSGKTAGFTEKQREAAGSWCSDILGVLGMEWI